MKCSGKNCPMQYPYDEKACAILETCPYATLIPYTNADRIRAMSDEDLACRNVRRVWITNSEYGWSEYITSDEESFEDYNVAIKHELEWLQKPA